ncbi:NAD(P)H-dependent oxidoreductase [Vibrio mangrovi]|uniref:General stress protein 14 n=1 Tax=Vibrio mangrovi TaxID=474394 RepID=A0A1Y6IYL0_9VIBR|nr:NAD(P)H-dependent oxidoreductase [Vibrio mangrovi]MDW6002557.1 NAD(P)H-dependent oxidoreductase [Vibrio mangrovi]SMS01910.1 General stress protein 14 [Vibrio mangrovi]
MKTLVIVSHPYADQSNVIKSLEKVALDTTDVTVRNLDAIYGKNVSNFDIAAEQAAYENMDRIVYLFPIHWFNITPMLKAYLNEVWTYGWAFGPEGEALKGKEMLVVTCAGASESTYTPAGLVQSTIKDVLTPMKASALYVGMKYIEPLAFYESMDVSSEKLASFQEQLSQRLLA